MRVIARSLQNYREVDFKIDGKDIKIGGMARPDRERITEESMAFLKQQGYDIIIGLEPSDEYRTKAKEQGIDYKSMQVEDFTPPSTKLCDRVFDTIQKATKDGKKIGIHCGEGYGRTGTLLAAIKLNELMLASSKDELAAQQLTETIHVGEHGGDRDIPCTPLVKQAVEAVRAAQGSEKSVEIESQVQQLIKYQTHIFLKKEIKYQHTALDNNDSRSHTFQVSAEKFKGLKKDYKGMLGDALKTKVLLNVKKELETIDSKEELDEFKKTFEKSDEFKVLKSPQGVATKLLKKKTSSQKSYESLISEKTQTLQEEASHTMNTIRS